MGSVYSKDYYQQTYGFNKKEMLELLDKAMKCDKAKALQKKKKHKVYIENFNGDIRVTARDGITTGELKILRERYKDRKNLKINI